MKSIGIKDKFCEHNWKIVMTRRGFVWLGTSAVFCSFFQPFSKAYSAGGFPVEDISVTQVDHLILGVSDLQEGIRAVEEQTGVRPIWGGRHPGGSTCNALISLGEKHYLEILAPDPEQEPNDRSLELKALRTPQLIGWAVSSQKIEIEAERLRVVGYSVQGPAAGSRERPNGSVLKWQTVSIASAPSDLVPFVIQWHPDSAHPSEDSPQGCRLKTLVLQHPDPNLIGPILKDMGLQVSLSRGSQESLEAYIETPRGLLMLT